MCQCVHAMVLVGEQRTTCRESVFSFYHVGPRDQTQVIRLGSKCLCGFSEIWSQGFWAYP